MRRYAVESARFLDAGTFYAKRLSKNALFLHIAAKEQSHFFHFTHFRPARGFRFPVNTGSRQAGLQPFARLFPDGEG